MKQMAMLAGAGICIGALHYADRAGQVFVPGMLPGIHPVSPFGGFIFLIGISIFVGSIAAIERE